MEWNERYAAEEFRYGTQPVPFLVDSVAGEKPGRALCIGAGEGRNAVWLARQGWRTTALDQSSTGLGKAQELAKNQGVDLEAVVADALEWDMGENRWDLITLFFIHGAPSIRRALHAKAARALAPGGLLVLEGFSPRQLGRNTGGPGTSKTGQPPPPDLDEVFIEPDELPGQLPGLEMELLKEEDIQLVGGTHHTGRGVVVHCLGRKTRIST